MHKTIISDCSCFIVLSNIGELDLLQKTYGTVITTLEVFEEFGQSLAEKTELEITGNMGVLIKAKQKNIISSIKPFLKK